MRAQRDDDRQRATGLAQADWQRSGIKDETADKLGFRILTPAETEGLGAPFQRCAGLLIPYFDLDGKETSFYRVRYLDKPPGFAGEVAKPQRYAQAKGTLNEVYFPPILPVPWRDVADDTNVPILITEGEKKSAAACQEGLACLGLGGVDVWRATKRGIDLLPALAEIKWQNRSVVVVFDSDAATNANVVRAQRQIVSELTARGALPAIASLPPAAGGKKQGLDDYLLAHGSAALLQVIEEADSYPESEALWRLNEEIVYIEDPGIVVVRDDGRKITPNNFVTHAYSNRHYVSLEPTKSGAVVAKKKPLARRWLDWERRFSLRAMTYEPGATGITKDNKWNLWPGWGCRPKPGDMAPWHWLLGFLFRDQPESKRWFEQWLAFHLQYPSIKMYTAAVLWGLEKGTGKTMVAYAMRAIYGKNFVEIKAKDLRGNFNGWAENRQFVYGDEITGGDSRIDADWLKGLITQHDMRINAKYMPEFTIPDCVAYLFTSNHPDAFFIEAGDRRFFIHEVVGPPAERRFYDLCDRWLKGDGPAALFDYLLRLDLTGFNPVEHAPLTSAKEAMINDGKSELAGWVEEMVIDPARVLASLGEVASKECELFTPTQLLYAFDPDKKKRYTATSLCRELKKAGIRQVGGGTPIYTRIGIQRLYAIRNHAHWHNASTQDCAVHFEKYFDPVAASKKKYA